MVNFAMNKKRKNKKMIKLVFAIIICFICVGVIAITFKYKCNYFQELGLKARSYERVKNRYGEPIDIYTNDIGCIYVCYDGISYVFENLDKSFYRVEITSEKYSFGLLNVKVGDSRKKIELLYKNNNHCVDDYDTENELIIFDDVYIIYFYFNDNKVSKITICIW